MPTTGAPTAVPTAGYAQIGQDIDGSTAGDQGGGFVAISADGLTIGTGSNAADVGGVDTGQVRVFTYDTSTWIQKGQSLNGVFDGEKAGTSVEISSDGNTVIYGGSGSGARARVYDWDAMNLMWVQRGITLTGSAVCISDDASIIAIGNPLNAVGGGNAGSIEVYEWDGMAWQVRGAPIYGLTGQKLGNTIACSGNASIVAAGAPAADGSAGRASVYQWDGMDYVLLGSEITAAAAGDQQGLTSMSLSDSGLTIVLGASFNDANGVDAGLTRVFDYTGGSWVQRGANILGDKAGDRLGYSTCVTDDGNIIAVGMALFDIVAGAVNIGATRMYQWNGALWDPYYQDLLGEAAGDASGISVAISPDASHVVVGAFLNDGNGASSGHTRVYQLFT